MMDSIQEAEHVIAKSLRAMIDSPGSQEDYDARVAYILCCKDMSPECRERLKRSDAGRRSDSTDLMGNHERSQK